MKLKFLLTIEANENTNQSGNVQTGKDVSGRPSQHLDQEQDIRVVGLVCKRTKVKIKSNMKNCFLTDI